MLLTEENCKEELIKIIELMLTPGDDGNPSVSWFSDDLKKGIIDKVNSSESVEDVSAAISVLRDEDGNDVPNQRYDIFMEQNHPSFERNDGMPATRLDVLNKFLEVLQDKGIIPGFSPNSPAVDSRSSEISNLGHDL